MNLKDHQAILERIRKKLSARLPVGCRVRLSPEAAKMFPRYAKLTGTVIRHAHSGTSPLVVWDGRKTGSSYHPDFIRRART